MDGSLAVTGETRAPATSSANSIVIFDAAFAIADLFRKSMNITILGIVERISLLLLLLMLLLLLRLLLFLIALLLVATLLVLWLPRK